MGLAVILIHFLILAALNLDFLPGFVGDEQAYRVAAWEIFTGGPRSNLEHPLLAKTILGFAAAVSVITNTDPVVGMRLASILAGMAALIAVYMLAARFFSIPVALTAVALLPANSLFLVHARMISPDIFALALLVAAVCCFLISLVDSSASPGRALALAGMFLGLSLSAKWIGIWLIPWFLVRSARAAGVRAAAVFLFSLILFYTLGNAAYFLNHTPFDAVRWHAAILKYHRISVELSPFNGSPAWTWFAIPQNIYYARLVPQPATAQMVLVAINPVVFGLTIPALWFAVSRARPVGASDHRARAARLLVEIVLCLYLPWLFVGRPTYFFYSLAILPPLVILQAWLLQSLWMSMGFRRAIAAALVGAAGFCFAWFYPAAVGFTISSTHEKIIARLNFYKRPVYSSLFCQECNLYAESGIPAGTD